jgi:crossover junction endodeoxyribonuclease RuvC
MIIGIDPGINGAAAVLVTGRIIAVIDLPTHQVGKWREIDVAELYQWLGGAQPHSIVIENVHSMPGEGVSSAFRFGIAFGMIKAMSSILVGDRLQLVEPNVWKEYFSLLKRDKEESRKKAQQLFPETGSFLTLKKHQHRAEAMLIAYWATKPLIGKRPGDAA